jgi:hypothetical protein
MTIPSELQQRKAYEFYQRRLELGEAGSSEIDWQRAGEYLEKQKFIVWWWHLRKRRKAVSKFLFTDLPKNELMKLLGVPVILVIATGIITDNLQKNAKENEIARQLEATQNERLIKYFDEMQDLIFNHKLMDKKPPKETLAIARAKTLTAVRLLDDKRTQDLTGFLQDSGLIKGNNSLLKGAYLKGANLEEAKFKEANLSAANLSKANLRGAVLFQALLSKTNLEETNLQGAFLFKANLSEAKLKGAYLEKANFAESKLGFADLREANLKGANFRGVELIGTNLRGARLNGTNFVEAKDLTPAKIKSACFWEKVIYKSDKNENQKFIEEVRNDSSSNPKEPPECPDNK